MKCRKRTRGNEFGQIALWVSPSAFCSSTLQTWRHEDAYITVWRLVPPFFSAHYSHLSPAVSVHPSPVVAISSSSPSFRVPEGDVQGDLGQLTWMPLLQHHSSHTGPAELLLPRLPPWDPVLVMGIPAPLQRVGRAWLRHGASCTHTMPGGVLHFPNTASHDGNVHMPFGAQWPFFFFFHLLVKAKEWAERR